MQAAFDALEQFMPDGVSWSRPTGGYALWIQLPRGMASMAVYTSAREAGVLVSPGTLFSYQGSDPGGIRLSLTRTDTDQIRQGVEILGRIVAKELKTLSQTDPLPETSQHL
jgi:DNA-binding transcriptional MocR family regulator